jgi:hypothetical protein
MKKAMPAVREDFKPQTPRATVIKIMKDQIGSVIGPGGKVVQDIQKQSGATVTIEEKEDGGYVSIFSANGDAMAKAVSMVRGIVTLPEVGEIYEGKVKNIQAFGAFVEFLPGKEYTVDCFTDKNGKLLFAEGRERVRINNGISFNTIPIQDESFLEMAKKINDNLSFRGAWFFQVKGRENKEKVLMEISPRIAGTMDLFRVKGVNFVLLGLHDMLNQEVKIINNNFGIELDRALSNKFKIDYDYESIYIDLDDTIIVNNQVNINVIKFLYQAKNENKKIILITRHIKNINKTLKKNFEFYSALDDLAPAFIAAAVAAALG